MTAILVVDAHNVIHEWWSPADGLEMGICRERLLSELASHAAMRGARTIVVFDAGAVAGSGSRDDRLGLEIHFSAADETADTVIERLCFALREAGETVTVATNDRLQAMVVFGKGVYRQSAGSLWTEIERSRREAKQALKLKRRQEKQVRIEHTLDAATLARLEAWRRGQ